MSDHIKEGKIVISPEELGDAISEQLKLYKKSVELQADRAGAKAINELVRITKDTAPLNLKHHGTHYISCITKKREKKRTGMTVYTWYVEPPLHRLTHLLVKGHKIVDENREPIGYADGDPFLKNACDKVFPEYEADMEKIVKDG